MASHPDADLLRKAQEGDEAAFELLYGRYRPAVYSYLYYRTSSAEISEELTSEVFARLVSKLPTIRVDRSPLVAWLYTVARNLAIERYRERERRQWLPLDEQLEAGDATNPLAQIEHQVMQAQLAAALACLTGAQRDVIVLKFVEGLSNAQVGQVIGKDEASVKSLQHRALAALRRIMANGSLE